MNDPEKRYISATTSLSIERLYIITINEQKREGLYRKSYLKCLYSIMPNWYFRIYYNFKTESIDFLS